MSQLEDYDPAAEYMDLQELAAELSELPASPDPAPPAPNPPPPNKKKGRKQKRKEKGGKLRMLTVS